MGFTSLPIRASSDTPVPFGREMRKQFLLDPAYKPLNHGSYGTFPIPILKEYRSLQEEQEGHPDTFIRATQPKYLNESRTQIAKFLNVPRQSLVYVKNASIGVNTVLRNLVYKPGDVVVYFSNVYEAVEKTLAYMAETTPLRGRKVEYEFPINHDELVRKFVEVIRQAKAEEGVNVKLAIFDTIVSNPGFRMPFERLVEVCREEGVLSCIDGAHGIGHIPLDLGKLDPDFFVSNCHKWLFTPRGTAVFYVPLRNQHLMRSTLPTSHGFGPIPGILTSPADHKPAEPSPLPQPKNDEVQTAYEFSFEFVGTADDLPYYCVPAALEFRQKVAGGEDRIMEYCEQLAFDAGNLVAEILGTEVLCEAESKNQKTIEGGDGEGEAKSQVRRCALVNVRLPIAINDGVDRSADKRRLSCPVVESEDFMSVRDWFANELHTTYKTFVPSFRQGGWMWVRLSAQVYLELEDFRWLGTVLKELSGRVGAAKLN